VRLLLDTHAFLWAAGDPDQLPQGARGDRGQRGLPDVHRDPFDRIMIAQAQIEGLTFVTRDPENQKYPIDVLEA
jgi:PIN domain nuclease of toxin-antitoxin system